MAGNNITIDLTNYKDRVGSRVPEDTYKVIVDDAELETAKSGNPMVNLWLRIHGGDHDGATIVDRLVLTENSMFRVVGFLQALGIKTPKKRLSLDITKFIGRSLEVTVRDGEPYNGRVKSEVSGYAKLAKESKPEPAADLEDVSSEPTDYDEDVEPEKAKAAAAKKAESEDDGQGEVDLDDLNDL